MKYFKSGKTLAGGGYARHIVLFGLAFLPLIVIALMYQPGAGWLARAVAAQAVGLVAVLYMARHFATPWLRRSLGGGLIILLAIFQLARLISFAVQGVSFNEQYFFHFGADSLVNTGTAFIPLMIAAAVYLCAMLASAWLASGRARPAGRKTAMPMLLAVFLLLEPDLNTYAQHLYSRYAGMGTESISPERLSALNLDPKVLKPVDLQAVGQGKNLVLIYLESLEDALTREQFFPGLTPNLQQLKAQGLTFTGLREYPGTSWTVAGIVSSQCGTPLLSQTTLNGNDLQATGFLGNATCLGDVLQAAGYRQEFIGGANREFAGKRYFLESHGYQKVDGVFTLRAQYPDLTAGQWGLYDNDLFDLAAKRFSELAGAEQPFNLTVLTLDTHAPGRPSPDCPVYPGSNSRFLQAVHCTDFLVGRFIEHLRQHPAWENTLVMMMSDHLAFQNTRQQDFPDHAPQQLLLTMLNGGQQAEVDVQGAHMDVAPTLLALAGVQHNASFLAGRDLLAEPQRIALQDEQREQERYIRMVNSLQLTPMANLCQSDPFMESRDGALFLGAQPLQLTRDGWPVALERLAIDQALLGVIGRDGSLQAYRLEDANDRALPDKISELRAENVQADYLLLIEPLQAARAAEAGEGTDVADLAAQAPGGVRVRLLDKQDRALHEESFAHWSQLSLSAQACNAMAGARG